MDLQRLNELASAADYLRVIEVSGDFAGFLLAFRAGAAYANDNFSWFSARYGDFVYVDRIVIAAGAGGGGLGSRLYEDLFIWAETRGVPSVTCEYNLSPPNPRSAAFHQRHGFGEVGTRAIAGGAKTVSMQLRAVG
jgi:predicted GNAT superfamily acetyltransferase